jgi:lipoprotein-releasing system ATP-binding protein
MEAPESRSEVAGLGVHAWIEGCARGAGIIPLTMSRGAGLLHLTEREIILRVEGLKKVFRSGESDLLLFENLSFQMAKGEMVAIVGESGAGKSTLLHILGALDSASAGDVYCAHLRLSSLSEDDAAGFRNHELGFVWQFHYLLPEFTAQENVAMPLLLRGVARREAEAEASRWLHEVGLGRRSHHRSGELSGGEQQRVALARALITKPKLLLADEPTGDLDSRTADAVFELIARLHRDYQLTSLIATHNLAFARRCHRVLRLQRGRIEEVAPSTLSSWADDGN